MIKPELKYNIPLGPSKSSEFTPKVRELVEKACTKTGLKVTADILDGVYEAGRTVTRHARASLNIEYDSTLPSWNYSIRPRSAA